MITIENKGKKIFLFGRNNKTPYIKEVKDFYPYFYVEDWRGKYKTVDDKQAKKIICATPFDIRSEREKYKETYEADVVYTNRYIIDKIDKIEKEEIRLCYLDIETEKTERGYGGPEEAFNPISSITCYDSFDKEYKMFYGKEKELLIEFISYIKEKDPDVLIAWNGDGFDFPFIINRMIRLNIEPKSLARMNGNVFTTEHGAKIFGRVLFDLMNAYKKHFSGGGRESWSLEYISNYELGEKGGKDKYKGELDDLRKNDFDKFLEYNKRDVELLVLINEKLKMIEFFDEIRRMGFCKFEDVFMNSKTADCLCLKYAKQNNFILPSVKKNPKEETYKGAFVHDSEPKLHRDIAVMDMKSLYPSVMIGFNISYETMNKDGEISIDNKYRFRKEKGIIPSIVKPLLDRRKEVKKQLKEVEYKSSEYKVLYMTQYALKVIANSFYGVLGFRNFRLYRKEVAEAITHISRKIIKEVAGWFEEKGFKIIYGDTDSVFIEMNDKSVEDMIILNDKINEYFKEYFKQFGIEEKDNIFKLEFEKVYKTVFFKRKADGSGVKKKYAGRIIWKEGYIDEFNVVGFESRRSDSPQVGRDLLKKVLRMIVYEKEFNDINECVEEFKNKVRIGYFSPEELALPIGLSKHPDKYGNQIHARASRIANEKHKANIVGGDKIKYIYVQTPERVIAFKDFMWEGYKVDYDNMIRRIVDMKIGPLFDCLGWDYDYIQIRTVKKKKELTYEEKLNQLELW